MHDFAFALEFSRRVKNPLAEETGIADWYRQEAVAEFFSRPKNLECTRTIAKGRQSGVGNMQNGHHNGANADATAKLGSHTLLLSMGTLG